MLSGWLAVIIVAFVLAGLWFTRDTLSAYAPEDTVAIVHLTPSRQAWTKLILDFGDLPLISARSLTIDDLSTFKPKEISIFILQNNESAVAIRTNEDNLPKETLNSYGINLQKIGRNRWLLSNKPLPITTKGKTRWSLGSIWPGTIGTVRLGDFLGHISLKSNGYVVDIPKISKTGEYLPALPEKTMAAISLQPNTELDLSALFSRFQPLLEALDSVNIEQIVQTIKEKGGTILLSQDGFLLETTLDSSVLSKIAQTSAALQSPTTKPMAMPDGSLVQELLIEPLEIKFESLWINGQEVKSVKTENGQILILDGEKTDIIASNQELFEGFLNKQTEKPNFTCGSKNSFIYLKPNEISTTFSDAKNYLLQPSLVEFALKFAEISLDKNKMYFCF